MLHYTSTGLGKTIVLIHGFCENSTCFNEQVFLLKDTYNIITIDLPGHGKSPVLSLFSIEDIADEVKLILTKEGLQECVLLGHSMGGYVTLAFAKKYGHLLKGFGLLNATANADNDIRKANRDRAIKLVKEEGSKLYVRNFIPPLFAPNTPKELVEKRQLANTSISVETIIACLTALRNREDNNALIQQTNLPAAFFIGKQDALIPEADMLAQASSAKVAKVVYLENVAHMCMLEMPREVATGMRAFAEFCFV
jgi:pimeloyl-ACP methyl ester carboxylesterase